MAAKIRHGAMVIGADREPKPLRTNESAASVWDMQTTIRVGVRGVEMTLTTEEGRAFSTLIIEAVRRAEKRQRETDPPQPKDNPLARGEIA